MVTTEFLAIYGKLLDYLVEKATPQEILAFEVSEQDKEYAQELVEHNSAGTLTPQEAAHLEQMAEFNLLVTTLKAKAMKALQQA